MGRPVLVELLGFVATIGEFCEQNGEALRDRLRKLILFLETSPD
jgi:hypothetical protein